MERKVFPGYVLVKMVMTDECWHIVRNIRGVTGFLGSGNKPIPLSESDIAALEMCIRDRGRRGPPQARHPARDRDRGRHRHWDADRNRVRGRHRR